MPFHFTSTSPSPKKQGAVFAGLDDPFNFPTTKMRYNRAKTSSRSSSRAPSPQSAADSGYGSSASQDDLDFPLSPKSQLPCANKRRLQRSSNGHWHMHSYGYQSELNNRAAERQQILQHTSEANKCYNGPRRHPDDDHEWKPNLKHTFSLIVQDPAKPKWRTTRVYTRALERKEENEGVTPLQRSMAPILRRPGPGPRKESTLLHPSAPLPVVDRHPNPPNTTDTEPVSRGRKPSTLLHPTSAATPARTPHAPSHREADRTGPSLRSPRYRSQTPLRIPLSSINQPAPTPLRVLIRKRSVLHSCFSDSEPESESEGERDDGEDDDDDMMSCASWQSGRDGWSAAGERNGIILARTAMVARAQRIRVGRAGVAGGEGWVDNRW